MDSIRIFLEEKGIDVFYAANILALLATLSYWKEFKNWRDVPAWKKGLAKSTVFATSVLTIVSILHMMGLL